MASFISLLCCPIETVGVRLLFSRLAHWDRVRFGTASSAAERFHPRVAAP